MDCPRCKRESGYRRKTKVPEWRCRHCGIEWDDQPDPPFQYAGGIEYPPLRCTYCVNTDKRLFTINPQSNRGVLIGRTTGAPIDWGAGQDYEPLWVCVECGTPNYSAGKVRPPVKNPGCLVMPLVAVIALGLMLVA